MFAVGCLLAIGMCPLMLEPDSVLPSALPIH